MATLTASLLTLVSISCAALAMWRIGTDLDWTGDFVFSSGLLSHWQVWAGIAVAVQYMSWRLTRYARKPTPLAPETGATEESPATARVIANV
jgi:hypothetical protein